MRKLAAMFVFSVLIALGIIVYPYLNALSQSVSSTNKPEVLLPNHITKAKVLTVAMFEPDDPKSEPPGEARLWIEGEKLSEVIEVPGSYSPVYCNAAKEHCLVITGMGTANATATMMALGLSNQLDLSETYVIVAGIAGVSPKYGTLGTAAWAEWVVDGDMAHEIDAREIPKEWSYPYFRLGCNQPWCNGWKAGTEVFHLNATLTDRAYQLSKNVELADNEKAQAYRLNYPEGTVARLKPQVKKCDDFASSTYWHGQSSSNWAEWWTKQWTEGKGNYCMSNMEDTGTLTALTRLAAMKRVDLNRVMFLRTASNFDQPYRGQTAQQSIHVDNGGFMIAIQNAYRVGVKVAHSIINNWEQWK